MRHRRLRHGITTLAAGVLLAVAAAPAAPAAAAAGAWSQQPAPNPNVQFSYLNSVDALSDTDAWTVGYIQPTGATPFLPIINHWNGTAWSSVSAPQLGDGTILNAVSASQTNDAWAVGYYFTHPPGYHIQTNPAALHWNGTAWTQTTIPDAAVVYGVAAVSPTNAWAVDANGGVKHWDGTAWSDVTTPSPNPSGVGPGALSAISARAANDVWVVGSFAPRRHVTAAFSLHFDGTAWQLIPVPAGLALNSVVSVGPNDAWAVGNTQGGIATEEPVTLHWNGTAWSVVASPTIPAGAALNRVSARAGNDVWAVGTAFTGEANSVNALTIHWNGTAWSSAPAPSSVVSPQLFGVSARPGTTRTWTTGTQQPGNPLILERH